MTKENKISSSQIMSDTETESESDLDFSASEDEYIPTDDDSDESDEYETVKNVDEPSSSAKPNKVKRKDSTRKNFEDDDDSDSSVENHLVNPNEIDLSSDFFNPNKTVASNVPKFDCNVGLNLSDTDEEIFGAVPSTSQDASVKMLDFNQHDNFHKQLENAKKQLQNFKSTHSSQDNQNIDVKTLLAIGEPSLVAKKSSKSKRKEILNSTDESDFEEVENDVETVKKADVEVRIGPTIKQKPNKHQAEIEASIKRKINRKIKENQVVMHKVHLLSWIAYGNFVNKVLNSTKLMEMVVKYIPSEKSYPKDRTDKEYFEQISRWYKTTVGLKTKEQNCNLKCLPPIATSLALQIQSKMAICKKDFVFIFIILLRSMGIQCRLVINLATVPLRPPAKDLCVISTKTSEKAKSGDKAKTEKKSTKKVKEASNDRNSKSKLKSKASSISGKKTGISEKSPEPSSKKTSSKTQTANRSLDEPSNGRRNRLKRSVSVQSVSSSSENKKRSRIEISNNSKATIAPKTGTNIQNDASNGTKETMSKASKSSSDNQKSKQSTKTKASNAQVLTSPISQRTRKGFARRASATLDATITSQTIPQLDGGDDMKKRKSDLFKIKFPLRSRSVSPSSSGNPYLPRRNSVALVSPTRGRTKSNLSRIKIPSTSRSTSKSPIASEHISRKSKFEVTKSNASSSKSEKSSTEQTKKVRNIRSSSKSCNPTTAATKTFSPSPSKLAPTADEKLSSKTGQKKNTKQTRAKSVQSNSANPSTLKIEEKADSLLGFSPIIRASAANKKVSPKAKASKSIPPDAIVSPTKTVTTSKKADAETKAVAASLNSTKSSKLVPSKVNSKTNGRTRTASVEKPTKIALKRKSTQSASSDSDFVPTPKKKSSPAIEKPLPKQVEKLKKRIDRRILSTDDESVEPSDKNDNMNYWIEVYCEVESKWMCIDLFKLKVNCVDDIKKKAAKPIAYVFAWNNSNKIKDVSPRYCSQWNTTTRKLRVQTDWLDEALSRYKEPLSQRCVAEDRELEEIHAQTPIPTSKSELKNHPLYVLPEHLLKFEGIYPPDAVPLGYLRDVPIYSRFCVHTLHSREIWVKQARVVKPGEIPYKIVKARPKWDRLANKMLEPQPLEIFGRWQTGPYVPPTAENGIVPRNAYGNVELFKPEMLPKKTVHLRLAGLNRVCAKLKIDCAQAVVGFDFHGGSSHPTFDGFVVCEEFAELVTERWCEEQEEAYRKSKEKQNQRVYDNWKKLIKGLLIRERLQRKYNFAGKDASTSSAKKN